MAADVDIIVVDISLIAEKGVGACYFVRGEEWREAFQLLLLCGETPRLKVEIERVVVHYVLAETLEALLWSHFAYSVEPFKFTPFPDAGREDVRKDK